MFRWYTESLSNKLTTIALAVALVSAACVLWIHRDFVQPQIALIREDQITSSFEKNVLELEMRFASRAGVSLNLASFLPTRHSKSFLISPEWSVISSSGEHAAIGDSFRATAWGASLNGAIENSINMQPVTIGEQSFLFFARKLPTGMLLLLFVPSNEFYEPLDHIQTMAIVTLLMIVVLSLLYTEIATRNLFSPLMKLHLQVERIMKGETPDELSFPYNDEIGKLTQAINKIGRYSKKAREMATDITHGVIQQLPIGTAEEDGLTESLKIIHRTLYTLNERLTSHLRYARQGNFIETSAEEVTQGAWKDIFQNINILFALIRAPLDEFDSVLQKFSAGDQSQRVIGRYRGIFERISNQLNQTLSGQEELVMSLKKTAEEFEKARDKAIELSDLKGQFLANMSHEIRTPMNGIIGLSDLLLDTELTPQQREYAGMVNSSSQALLTIINDILDFSKIESGKMVIAPAEFSIRSILYDIEKLFSARIQERKIHYLTTIADDVPERLYADPDRVRQVLLNLIGNAIKFTRMNGGVIVFAQNEVKDGESFLCVHVSDSGIGIPKEKYQAIFEAFTQADASTTRNYGGTGLGLAISKNLTQLMGGSLSIESRLEEGSKFTFRIPYGEVVNQNNLLPAPTASAVQNLPIASSLKVLLAEDNIINQKLFISLLERVGITPVVVANGEEAVSKAEKDHFDLIFLDIQMPIMDGVTAIQHIRKLEPQKDVPIIALTAHAMEGDQERYLEAGFDQYLTKPLNRAHLMKILGEQSEWIKNSSGGSK